MLSVLLLRRCCRCCRRRRCCRPRAGRRRRRRAASRGRGTCKEGNLGPARCSKRGCPKRALRRAVDWAAPCTLCPDRTDLEAPCHMPCTLHQLPPPTCRYCLMRESRPMMRCLGDGNMHTPSCGAAKAGQPLRWGPWARLPPPSAAACMPLAQQLNSHFHPPQRLNPSTSTLARRPPTSCIQPWYCGCAPEPCSPLAAPHPP